MSHTSLQTHADSPDLYTDREQKERESAFSARVTRINVKEIVQRFVN